MTDPNKIKTVMQARGYAENCIKQGVATLAHGLNACNDENINYRYGVIEQERFKHLVMELIDIVENGEVELLLVEYARRDKQFQTFLAECLNV